MDTKAIIDILINTNLKVDRLSNAFNVKALKMVQHTAIHLEVMLQRDRYVVDSIEVVALIVDDIKTVQANLKVIKSAINIKELKFEEFCFN